MTTPHSRGDNDEKGKEQWRNLKIFSRSSGPISTKVDTIKASLGEENSYLFKGPRPFPKKDNYETAKIDGLLKSSSEPIGQFQP